MQIRFNFENTRFLQNVKLHLLTIIKLFSEKDRLARFLHPSRQFYRILQREAVSN